MLLYLLSFEGDDSKLGVEELLAEKEKQEARQRLKRRMLGEEGVPKSSTAASQVAKKLTRLTLGALLADAALSQATGEKQCPALQTNRDEVTRLELIVVILRLVILAL